MPHPNPSIPCLPSSSPSPPSIFLRSATMISDLCSSVTTNSSPTPTLNSMEPTPTPPQQPGNRTSRLPVAETRAAAGIGQERGRREERQEGKGGRKEGTASRSPKGRKGESEGRKGGNSTYHIRPATAAAAAPTPCSAMLCNAPPPLQQWADRGWTTL